MSARVFAPSHNYSMQDNSSVRVLSVQTSRRELQALSDDELSILNNLQHTGFTSEKSSSSPPDCQCSFRSMMNLSNISYATVTSNFSTSSTSSKATKQPRNSQVWESLFCHSKANKIHSSLQGPLLKLPVPIIATKPSSSALIRRPSTPVSVINVIHHNTLLTVHHQHTTKVPSPLGPYRTPQPLRSSSSMVHRTPTAQLLHRSTLVRAANRTAMRTQPPPVNHHPRHATVLGGKLNRRHTPYLHPAPRQGRPKSFASQHDNISVAMRVLSPPRKGDPRLSSLSHRQQDTILRGFIKHVHPHAGKSQALAPRPPIILSPPVDPVPANPPPSIPLPPSPTIPAPSSAAPSDSDSPTTITPARLDATPTHVSPPHVLQSCDHIDSPRDSEPAVAAPEPVRVLVTVGLQWPEVKDVVEPEYDPVAHEARRREVFREIFPTPTPPPSELAARPFQPTPPPVECLARLPSPTTSDEGYEGSDPEQEEEMDQLTDELVDERSSTPAYRKALPVQPASTNEPPKPDAPIELDPPSLPQPYPSSTNTSHGHPHLFIPRSHRLPELSAHTSTRRNWAQTERPLERAPKVRSGWDKTAKGSRRAAESRQYYRDEGAKPLPTIVPHSSSAAQAIFAEWIQAIRQWYVAGKNLFHASYKSEEEELQRKKYARALKRALEADDGFPPGVKKLYPPAAKEFVDFLYDARRYDVNERWGEGAMALKARIEEYAVVVEDKVRAMHWAVQNGNAATNTRTVVG